jgi:hypothetical protein
MVIARLFGGLGNQLFIYGTARALALRNGMQLALDIESGFKYDSRYQRRFMLQHFNIEYTPASKWDPLTSPSRIGLAALGLVRRADTYAHDRWLRWYLRDRPGEDMGKFLQLPMPRRVYLDGYWQSERYFKEYEDQIRAELTVRAPISQQSIEMARVMASCDSIAVHARRLHEVRAGHAPDSATKRLPLEYYSTAIHMIAERVKRGHLFCFADYPEWRWQDLRTELPVTLVTHNSGELKSYEDLWLMTNCKHHVIADSTFSWWGAWLCNYKDKIVISPEPSEWRKIMEIPSGWLVLESRLFSEH